MEKYWEIRAGNLILVKVSSRYFGQQSLNEVFASRIHERQDGRLLSGGFFFSERTNISGYVRDGLRYLIGKRLKTG